MTHLFDVRFRCPSTAILSGPSNSGKTTLVYEILKHARHIFHDPRCIQNVIFFYKQWQNIYDIMQQELKIDFINSVPTIDVLKEKTQEASGDGGSIVIIDDFMQELTKDVSVLFSTLSHHLNIVVFLMTQNLFSKNPVFRDISLNATYNIIFKNPRDASQISYFARQYAPGKTQLIVDMFKRATKKSTFVCRF